MLSFLLVASDQFLSVYSDQFNDLNQTYLQIMQMPDCFACLLYMFLFLRKNTEHRLNYDKVGKAQYKY